MRKPALVLRSIGACGLAVGLGFVAAPVTASASNGSGPSMTVVASHLNNPRGLSASDDGKLYLAEAGRGSTNHCLTDPTGATTCVGQTGSIDLVGGHGVTRLVTGLISIAGQGGVGAEGMVAVSASGGALYGQFGANTSGIPPSGLPTYLLQAAHRDLGQFGRVRGASFVDRAGVGDFDFIWANAHTNLNPQFPDSNPNGVLVTGGKRFVADAGANTLDEVTSDGHVHVLTYFGVPSGSPTDAVPTCVAKGPDGALYVGELLGGSFAPGGARIWRVVVNNDGTVTKSVWARGLTTVQGCGFDHSGNFYATEFQVNGLDESPTGSPLGALVKIAPDGSRTTLGTGSLFFPSGFAAGSDGSLFVSNCSIAPASGFGPCPNGGQVVQFH
jgi:hypothetical protein